MRVLTKILFLAALTISCGSQGIKMNTTIQRGPMPQGGTWGGLWFSSWGQMALTAQGSTVVGEFCDDNSNRYGRVEGSGQGDVFTFRWVTHDVSMGGRVRSTEGSGIVQLKVEGESERPRLSFEGTWGYENTNADGGPISGERSSRYSERFLRGQYTIPCPIREEGNRGAPLSDEEVGDNPDPPPDDESEEEEGAVVDWGEEETE